jgi:hypothetical protein
VICIPGADMSRSFHDLDAVPVLAGRGNSVHEATNSADDLQGA